MDLWLAWRQVSPFYLLAQVRDVAKNEKRREWSLQKPQAPAALIQDPLFWYQLSQLSLCREEIGDWGKGNELLAALGVDLGENVPKFCRVAVCVRTCVHMHTLNVGSCQ